MENSQRKMVTQGRLRLGLCIFAIKWFSLTALKFQDRFVPERHLYGTLGLIIKPRIQTVLLEKQTFYKNCQISLPRVIMLQSEFKVGNISCDSPIKYLYLNNLAYTYYMEMENYKSNQIRINTDRNNLENVMHVRTHQHGSENVFSPLEPDQGVWLDTM